MIGSQLKMLIKLDGPHAIRTLSQQLAFVVAFHRTAREIPHRQQRFLYRARGARLVPKVIYLTLAPFTPPP